MYNLKDITFIIPLFIDSEDRLNNLKSVLGYLNHNFTTNIIIHELIKDDSYLDFSSYSNLNIVHLIEPIGHNNYHRTRQLNKMLNLVQTPIVCNYDIDVLLPVTSYIIAQKLLIDNLFDVIYPFGFGDYQWKVEKSIEKLGIIFNNKRSKFDSNYLLSKIEDEFLTKSRAEYGHCQFFRTDIYKSIGGENENFISYGPEDVERYHRCVKFGLRLYRIKDYVYHLEHTRTSFSNKTNPDFIKNDNLFNQLKEINEEDYFSYYKGQGYIKKYNWMVDKAKNYINPDWDINRF